MSLNGMLTFVRYAGSTFNSISRYAVITSHNSADPFCTRRPTSTRQARNAALNYSKRQHPATRAKGQLHDPSASRGIKIEGYQRSCVRIAPVITVVTKVKNKAEIAVARMKAHELRLKRQGADHEQERG